MMLAVNPWPAAGEPLSTQRLTIAATSANGPLNNLDVLLRIAVSSCDLLTPAAINRGSRSRGEGWQPAHGPDHPDRIP
jgi:hypothetical protein